MVVWGHPCHHFPILKRKKIQFVSTHGPPGPGLAPAIFRKILMQASAKTQRTSLFCQEVLLSGVDNASGQYLDYATLKLLNSWLVFRCCGGHINANNLTCVCLFVFVFPVETTVEDRQRIASQETEQPSVPVHTGNFVYHTLPPISHVHSHLSLSLHFPSISPLRPAEPTRQGRNYLYFLHTFLFIYLIQILRCLINIWLGIADENDLSMLFSH